MISSGSGWGYRAQVRRFVKEEKKEFGHSSEPRFFCLYRDKRGRRQPTPLPFQRIIREAWATGNASFGLSSSKAVCSELNTRKRNIHLQFLDSFLLLSRSNGGVVPQCFFPSRQHHPPLFQVRIPTTQSLPFRLFLSFPHLSGPFSSKERIVQWEL